MLAIDHMHVDLLHRDIKPANIFITQSGLVKLATWCCQMLSRPDETVTSDYGSPLYVSPEIWQTGTCSHKSDIWSIGCVVYELLAHAPPFVAPELAYKVLTASPPELPSRYSPDLRALVVQMLEKDPSKRPGAMELIRDQTVAHFITHWLSAGLTPLGRGVSSEEIASYRPGAGPPRAAPSLGQLASSSMISSNLGRSGKK